MVKVVITAPRGAMDSLIVQEAFKNDNIEVVGCVGTPGADYIGRDAGQVCGLGQDIGALVYDDLEAKTDKGTLIDLCDVVVDYSRIEVSMDVLEKCVAHGKAYLCGTTGFSEEQLEAFAKASDSIAQIIELHSDTKLDAPSGTAIEMAEEMAAGMKEGGYEDITFHSVRAGNTPSSHHVLFGCQGEMFQITHDAYDWRCYAIGACDAILYLGARKEAGEPGSYTMFDVIG